MARVDRIACVTPDGLINRMTYRIQLKACIPLSEYSSQAETHLFFLNIQKSNTLSPSYIIGLPGGVHPDSHMGIIMS
jgi:hypothetical protein